jgi:NAD(P)-dependent dehydrogenase (short-subunit alcohol dehydrogenase family)
MKNSQVINQKNVFITGGAGGLGRATSYYLAARGWHVFAADFDKASLDEMAGVENVTPVLIDVLNTVSVTDAVSKVKEQVDGLDAVVNFAGIMVIGSGIELDEAIFQRVLNVNVMGTYRVNQACFPLLKVRKGRIVNISSETGWMSGGPFNGAYASSKHAIEAYSDSLRRELALLDMPVIKIQPGPFKTNMVNSIEANFSQASENSLEFKANINKLKGMAIKEGDKGHDPDYLALIIHRALTAAKPKAAYSVKPDPGRSLLEYLPTRWVDALLKKVMTVS